MQTAKEGERQTQTAKEGETSALEQHSHRAHPQDQICGNHASQKIIVSENHLAAPLPKNVTTVTKLAPLAVPRVSLF
jgi:hypothetical protein